MLHSTTAAGAASRHQQQPMRPRHSSSSSSARAPASTTRQTATMQRPRPRTTIEGGASAAAASSAASSIGSPALRSLQGAGIETVPAPSSIGPRDRSAQPQAQTAGGSSILGSHAASAGGSIGVGGARPVWSNAYSPAAAVPTPPLPAVPARFCVKDASSNSGTSSNGNSATPSNHTSPTLGTRTKRNINAAATAMASSTQSSARGSPPTVPAAAAVAAPFKLSTPSSLEEVLALSASAHAMQAAQAVPIAPRKTSEARARSRNHPANQHNSSGSSSSNGSTVNSNPRHHPSSSSSSSSSSSTQLFASHGTPAKRTLRNGVHGASNADLQLPQTCVAGSPAAAVSAGVAPDPLGELLPRAKALTLASRGGVGHKLARDLTAAVALSPPKSNGTATPTPPLDPPASSLQQRSANPRKRGGGGSRSALLADCSSSPEAPSTSPVSPQQRAARKAHLQGSASTAQPVPSLAFPSAVPLSADLVSASAVAPASTSFSSAASSVSCPNNFPLPAHHNPLSDDDDAEEQALQESLRQHDEAAENASNRGQEEDSEYEEDEDGGGVAQVQGSFDGHALFDHMQPPAPPPGVTAPDDDRDDGAASDDFSDNDDNEYSVPAALSPPFVSQPPQQQQPMPSFDSALRRPQVSSASAAAQPTVAEVTPAPAIVQEPAVRTRTPPPPHDQWNGSVSVAAMDPVASASSASADSPFARDRSPSFSSSLPRAPSALQHQHPLRGRVSAASLRPFTPNVAPIASTLETPPPTPPPPVQPAQRVRTQAKPKVIVAGVKHGSARRGGAREGGSKSVDRLVIAQGKGDRQMVEPTQQPQQPQPQQQTPQHSTAAPPPPPLVPPVPSDEVALMYDPILQCYYDPVAHIYYELS